MEKDFATMLDRLSELKFLITESSNSCKVDVQRVITDNFKKIMYIFDIIVQIEI